MKKTMKILLLALVMMLTITALAACGHQHTYKPEWSYDGSHHWHAGSCVHEKAEDAAPNIDFALHTMGEPVTVAPTCGKAGSTTTVCTTCGYTKVVTIAATGNHTYNLGKIGYRTVNGSIFTQKLCDTCDKADAYLHMYDAKWSTDMDQHWHVATCACADANTIQAAAHNWVLSDGGSYEAAGSFTKTCSTCNYTMNVVVVTTTAEAQAALDAAVPNTEIYFAAGNYGTLLFRADESANTATYDSANSLYRTLYYREFKNLILTGAEGAILDAIAVEAGAFEGTRPHSIFTDGGQVAIALENVIVRGLTFSGAAENAILLEQFVKVNGLTLDACKMTDADKDSRLLYARDISGISAEGWNGFEYFVKNITVKNCVIDGAAIAIELRAAENVTIIGNSFKNLAGQAILLANKIENTNAGITYTGAILVKDNTADAIAERFLRGTAISGSVTVTGNTVTNYTGTDTDIIKIDNSTGTVTEEDNTLPTGTIVTVPTPPAGE